MKHEPESHLPEPLEPGKHATESHLPEPLVVNPLGAIVLVGGASARMGRPKAWLPFGPGEVLLTRTVRVLSACASPIVVVAAPSQELPELPREIVVVRDATDGEGPLAGFVTGLEALAPYGSHAFVTATDTPFLATALVTSLRAYCEGHDAAVPFVHGRHHPLAAVYATRLVSRARELFDHGERRMCAVVALGTTHLVTEAELRAVDPELLSLENLNTPADYEAALTRLMNSANIISTSSIRA